MQKYFSSLLIISTVVLTTFFLNFGININLEHSMQEWQSILSNQKDFNKNFKLESIEFGADIFIDNAELIYLTSLNINKNISMQDLLNAFYNIKKKSKFQSIDLTYQKNRAGIKLKLFLNSYQTFYKVELITDLREKYFYLQFYDMQYGDIFDMQKHQACIKNMEKHLQASGYFKAKVESKFIFDEKNKQVTVKLYLNNINIFVIKDTKITYLQTDFKVIQDGLINEMKDIFFSLKNSGFDKILILETIRKAQDCLLQYGYLKPKISIKSQADFKNNSVILNFEINLKFKKKIVFKNNIFFTNKQILKELVHYNFIIQDVEKFYRNNGFLDVKVSLQDSTNKLTPNLLVFNVFEGKRSKLLGSQNNAQENMQENKRESEQDEKLILVYDIDIVGYPELLKEPIFSKFKKLKKSIKIDSKILIEQKQLILSYLQSRGLIYCNISYEFVFNEELNSSRLVWNIKKICSEVKFGKIIVNGVCPIKFNTLLKQISFKEGDLFDKAKIYESKNNLKALNIFEHCSIYPDNISKPESKKDIIINLAPDYFYEFRTRFGFQQISKNFTYKSGSTFKLGISFICKNLSYRADVLKFDGDITRYSRGIFLQYSLSKYLAKLYATSYNQPLFLGSSETLYKASRDGFSTSSNNYFKLFNDSNFKTNINTGIEFLKISGLSVSSAKQINYAPDLVNKREPYFYFEPYLSFSNTDDKINPHKNLISLFSGRAMLPFKIHNGTFFKLCLEQSFVYAIYHDIIFAAKLRLGHIFHKNFTNIMPSERFYLGGSSSLRGYAPNMVPPLTLVTCDKNNQDLENIKDSKNYLVPVGGKSMINGNLELRFPIYSKFQGALFSDFGVLAQSKKTIINGSKWVVACGMGVRYFTPIGPIRFDVGFKLNKHHIPDKNYAWYLTFGQAF